MPLLTAGFLCSMASSTCCSVVQLLWQLLSWFVTVANRTVPYHYEIDLVNRIAFRDLDYAVEPDSFLLEFAAAIREKATNVAAFEDELCNLVTELPKFVWPTMVVFRWPSFRHTTCGGQGVSCRCCRMQCCWRSRLSHIVCRTFVYPRHLSIADGV